MLRHLLHRTASVVACSLHTQTPHAQMDLHSIVSRLERLAPTDRAEDWDNVGLLIEPSGNPVVQRILVTNDLTESVLEEAASLPGKKVNLIISYHPPIFTPIRRLTQVSAKERIVLQCVSSQMAVYSPHTALDRRINSWLVQGLGSGTLTHFTSTADTKVYMQCLYHKLSMSQCVYCSRTQMRATVACTPSLILWPCPPSSLE